MKNLKKISPVCAALIFLASLSATAFGQDRPRVVKTVSIRPTAESPAATGDAQTKPSSAITKQTSTRPVLTSDISLPAAEPLVKNTVLSAPSNISSMLSAEKVAYGMSSAALMLNGIKAKFGLPYVYGASGPRGYDCSGFVWAVFADAGINFTRQNVRSLWAVSDPVEGADRFKFGTLVFLNQLGHMGIVADENGFYHASSSKGVTYSTFKGYWQNRIVGFRRLNPAAAK